MIQSVGDILEMLPVKGRIKEYGLWKAWDSLVGPQVAMHCQPERIRDGILFLKVDNNVWMHQLQFMKSALIKKVNGQMGNDVVGDVRFRIGTIRQYRKKNAAPWRDISLDKEVIRSIDSELTDVSDLELKRILRRIREKEAKLKFWKSQRNKGASSSGSPV